MFAPTRAIFLAFLLALRDGYAQEEQKVEYGVDVSFPMQHSSVTTNYPWLPHNMDRSLSTPKEYQNMPIQPLGDKQTFYEQLIQGCVDHYGSKGKRCLRNEKDRIEMSLRQPASMINYTKMGFTKIRAPDRVFQLLKDFWELNKHSEKVEQWGTGNTYVNHWDTPSYLVSVEDPTLFRAGPVLKQIIWDTARATIEEWTDQELVECSLYGIRVYKEGAVLAPHVDRNPLVSSAIINVDQDVDEPWPLEVIGHDGRAYNVTMKPGDLVLYESHSILHGRPFPLKGRFMANVFVHFEPVGPLGENNHDTVRDLPPYVIPGSPEESVWRSSNPGGYKIKGRRKFTTGTTEAHSASMDGNLDRLKQVLEIDAAQINAKDSKGWTPLHLAVRSGHTDIVKYLLERGADVNSRTLSGGSVLWWALKKLGEDHEVVEVLKEYGGKTYGKEL